MPDHTVLPQCEKTLDALAADQGEMAKAMEAHGNTLVEHTQILVDHGRQLSQLHEITQRQTDAISTNSSMLNGIESEMSIIKELLDKLTGHQMKLIFVLVSALIVLAGVTKLVELGIA